MTNSATDIKLRKPEELITVIPYLLGFHPEHSLVVVGMAGQEVRCVVRTDVPDSGTPSSPGTEGGPSSNSARGRQRHKTAACAGPSDEDCPAPVTQTHRACECRMRATATKIRRRTDNNGPARPWKQGASKAGVPGRLGTNPNGAPAGIAALNRMLRSRGCTGTPRPSDEVAAAPEVDLAPADGSVSATAEPPTRPATETAAEPSPPQPVESGKAPTPIRRLGGTTEIATVPTVELVNDFDVMYLPDPDQDAPPASISYPDLSAFLLENGCDRAILVGYGAKSPVKRAVGRFGTRLAACGVKVVAGLRVWGDRWWSVQCEKDDCCTKQGRPIPETSAAATSLISMGSAALSSREEMAGQLRRVDEETYRQVRKATGELLTEQLDDVRDWSEVVADEIAAVGFWMDQKHLPPVSDIAALSLSLADTHVRGAALERINREPGSGRLDLWVWLVRHMDDAFVAPAATLAGFCAYRLGNGIFATMALERALQSDPQYKLAEILLKLLRSGVSPETLGQLLEGPSLEGPSLVT
ncbi:DUF4192 domain-containing protein [Natronoglycomyces albus]|uniref:DUF4192 family protein n=1 Tax=Natronoglycomyces albus TaxID=2811108 RepID=A0A895XPC0_9ACTN|nr:DUF4192 domain-containing protein [Natronoglycomyces albus]QSB05393.1 DUF4192 family protein [Natronoglycomyces albus]